MKKKISVAFKTIDNFDRELGFHAVLWLFMMCVCIPANILARVKR